MFSETTIPDFPTTELALFQDGIDPGSSEAIGHPVITVDDDLTEPLAGTHSRFGLSQEGNANGYPQAELVPASRALLVSTGIAPGEPAAPVRELAVGSVLRSRYVLEDVIGQGGDAIVFRARDLHPASSENRTGPYVAIKALLPEKRLDPNALRRLQRGFQQMQLIDHPGIARQRELDCDGDIWFICMELIEGRTANKWLNDPRSLQQAVTLIGACCDALAHAHSLGIVHGDLKPSNVLIDAGDRVMLIDFGCAAAIQLPSTVQEWGAAATSSYASPEVLVGKAAEERDDVFSLACLSYVILSKGRHPFTGTSSLAACADGKLPDTISGVPAGLSRVLMRGLSAERAHRPESAKEFFRQLSDAVAASPEGEKDGPAFSKHAPQARACESTAPSCASADVHPGVLGLAANENVPEAVSPALTWRSVADKPDTAPSDLSGNTQAEESPLQSSFLPSRPGFAASLPVGLNIFRLGARGTVAQRCAAVAGLAIAVVGALALVQELKGQRAGATVAATRTPAIPSSRPTVLLTPSATAPTVSPPVATAPATAESVRKAPASGRVTFVSSSIHVARGQSLLAIPIKRLEPTRDPALVTWVIENGSGQIRDSAPGRRTLVRFIEGQAVRSIFIPLASANAAGASYGPRTFTVALRKVAGGPGLGPVSRISVSMSPPYEPQLARGTP